MLQLKWQYLQRNITVVDTMMGPIKEALRETFFPTLFGGAEVDTDFGKILGHSVKHGGLGLTNPWS